jgi:RNA polymerase sigma-70 factor (ECF subfamily)
MTTDTLSFPVFHSEQGIDTDEVLFTRNSSAIGDISTAKDVELARVAGQGNIAAFEEIYNRHHRRVYAVCLRMLQNASEAEDLTQDVFIQLYRKIGSFRGDSAFTTWLHRMTVNQVLMHFRKRSVKYERTTEEGDTPDQMVAGTTNPERMRIVDKIALDNAIEQLPKGYKNVFVLHDVEGFEHEEVAKILGCSVGTSKSQLHKARLKLQKLLKKKANPRLLGISS